MPVRLFSGRRTFPGRSEKLGKNHSGKHESAAEQFPPGKSLVQQQSPAQGTKHTFKAHQQRGQRRRQMLLPNDLNGIGSLPESTPAYRIQYQLGSKPCRLNPSNSPMGSSVYRATNKNCTQHRVRG